MNPAIRTAVLAPAPAGERAALEHFIAERFDRTYGARVTYFCTHLLGLRAGDGGWRAAAGYTPAASRPLFLERYLDAPVEDLVCVERSRIAEVGNLAAEPGMGRALIPALGAYLHELGYRWVVFTATRQLRNAFRRLRLEPVPLAPALAARLPDGGRAWGTYYAQAPFVMAGRISACLAGRRS